jgi:hypothetical protein
MRDLAFLGARLLLAQLLLVAAFNKLVVYASVIGYFGELGRPEPSVMMPAVSRSQLGKKFGVFS